MQLTRAIILAFAATITALALENPSPVEHLADRAGEAASAVTAVGNCSPGKYSCATLKSGGKTVCKSCAIVVGNSGGKCQVNNLCRQADNSCQVRGGQPFCV